MTFRKVHYTISNSHPKLVVKNYFSSTAAQKFKDFSSTFKDLPCFQALSRALNFKNKIQALSKIFEALCEPSANARSALPTSTTICHVMLPQNPKDYSAYEQFLQQSAYVSKHQRRTFLTHS